MHDIVPAAIRGAQRAQRVERRMIEDRADMQRNGRVGWRGEERPVSLNEVMAFGVDIAAYHRGPHAKRRKEAESLSETYVEKSAALERHAVHQDREVSAGLRRPLGRCRRRGEVGPVLTEIESSCLDLH